MDNKAIIEKLTKDRDAISNTISDLQAKLQLLNSTIEFYTATSGGSFLPEGYEYPINNEYPVEGTWKEKVLFLLENNKLSASDLYNKVRIYEPNLDTDLILKNISQSLWALKNAEKLNHEGKLYSIKN